MSEAVRDAAARLGVSSLEPLRGSMSGSLVFAGRTPRGDGVVLKVTSHDTEGAVVAARRELTVYAELPQAALAPELVAVATTSDWTAIALRRYEPMPPPDAWTDQDWLALAEVLAELHELPTPFGETWSWPAWSGLDPDRDRQALERLWRTRGTMAALDRVVASRPELVRATGSVPTSLIHGDCHTGNVLRRGGTVILCDWQSARTAPGGNDIAFLLTRAIPSGAKPPLLLDRYCALRGLPRDEVADAVRAEQLLVLALQYPAFVDHLQPVAVERLGRAFLRLADQS